MDPRFPCVRISFGIRKGHSDRLGRKTVIYGKEDSGGNHSGWRSRRLFRPRPCQPIHAPPQREMLRRIKTDRDRRRRILKLEIQRTRLGRLLLALGRRNRSTQRTEMLAVKRLGNRLRHGLAAEISRQHGGPRHRLERRPMQSCGQDQGQHHQKFASASEHRLKVKPNRKIGKP